MEWLHIWMKEAVHWVELIRAEVSHRVPGCEYNYSPFRNEHVYTWPLFSTKAAQTFISTWHRQPMEIHPKDRSQTSDMFPEIRRFWADEELRNTTLPLITHLEGARDPTASKLLSAIQAVWVDDNSPRWDDISQLPLFVMSPFSSFTLTQPFGEIITSSFPSITPANLEVFSWCIDPWVVLIFFLDISSPPISPIMFCPHWSSLFTSDTILIRFPIWLCFTLDFIPYMAASLESPKCSWQMSWLSSEITSTLHCLQTPWPDFQRQNHPTSTWPDFSPETHLLRDSWCLPLHNIPTEFQAQLLACKVSSVAFPVHPLWAALPSRRLSSLSLQLERTVGHTLRHQLFHKAALIFWARGTVPTPNCSWPLVTHTYHQPPDLRVISLLDYNLIGDRGHALLIFLCPAVPRQYMIEKLSVEGVNTAVKGPCQSNRHLDPNS